MNKDSNKNKDPEESENIPKELIDIINDIPEKHRGDIIKKLTISQCLTSFQGPLPPPEVLKEYQSVLPGSPDRFLSMVEKEQNHTHSKENIIINNQILQNWAGLIIGAIIVILFFIGAYKLAVMGHETVAGIIFSVTIISIATIFVLHKRSDNNSDKEKESEHDLQEKQ